jgi:regulator of sigma E protease
MFTLVIFIAVLAVLVLSHEWGHFFVARKNKIKVDEFGFGFPPRLVGIQRLLKKDSVGTVLYKKWKIVRGGKDPIYTEEEQKYIPGTLYSINIIPLGGFVKIKGENAADVGANDADSFASKKAWQKAAVLLAGVGMNVLVAMVLISIGFMVGLPQNVAGLKDVSGVKDRKLQILQVLPQKPAEAAGLKVEDEIVGVGEIKNPRFDEFQEYVNKHRTKKIMITVKRGNDTIRGEITPIIYEDTQKAGIGVGLAEFGTVRLPWYKAISQGFLATFIYLKEIFVGFYTLLYGLFTGKGAGGAVSGPVGVAVMTGQVARMGFVYLLQFTALLSLNLAVLNVLPIPALDGGRLLFVVIAKIMRRPVTPKVEQITHSIGFALLMLLVVFVTIKDLGSFKDIFIGAFKRIF